MKIHCTYADNNGYVLTPKYAKHFHQARVIHTEYYIIFEYTLLMECSTMNLFNIGRTMTDQLKYKCT